jgi:hypothetical protein
MTKLFGQINQKIRSLAKKFGPREASITGFLQSFTIAK